MAMLWRFLGGTALVAVSAATGWMLNDGGSAADHAEAQVAAAPPAPAFSVLGYPRPPEEAGAPRPADPAREAAVTLHGDGTVTIDVRHRPWRWVLEEVARQENARAQAPGGPAADAAADRSSAAVEAQQEEVLQALRSGDEASRYEVLLNARTNGTPVPDDTLKQLFEIDASERVRLLAFENYLERKSGSAEEVRSALEAALYIPSPAIQAEARQLLEQLDAQERGAADDPQALAEEDGS